MSEHEDIYHEEGYGRMYLETYHSGRVGPEDDGPVYQYFVYPKLAECFESLKCNRVLEIGCGPTIHSAAIASKNAREIVMSDVLDNNLEEVRKWLQNEPNAFDWRPMMDYLAEIEGSTGDVIADRVRQKVTGLLRGNVPKDGILESSYCQFDKTLEAFVENDDLRQLETKSEDSKFGKFNAIVSFSCLIAACSTKDQMAEALCRFNQLLVPGGHLIMVTTLENEYYVVNGERFQNLYLTLDDVHLYLRRAGFRIMRSYYRDMERIDFRYTAFKSANVVLARKI